VQGQAKLGVEAMADDAHRPMGAEYKTTAVHLVTVFINTVPHEIPRGDYTTEALIAALKDVPAGHVLDIVEKEHGQPVLRELQPGEITKVKQGDEFISHVPTGGAA
jgi:hypothetical protein